MPWRQEAMKDVPICEKLRGADKGRQSSDVRMGGTQQLNAVISIIRWRGEPGEVKHLSTPRKRNQPRYPQ